MIENEVFFNEQTEQSEVKAKIVASYFTAWARVIKKWNTTMGYIDLFCGPGKYENDKDSAPVLILRNVLEDLDLVKKMYFIFNDQDPQNIELLKTNIGKIDSKDLLKNRISFYNFTVEKGFEQRVKIPKDMPVLSFVDPFGYKGLTMNLINLLITNHGSDCIFFFNYNRINMALSNTKFDEHLKGLFGEQRTAELKEKLTGLTSSQREMVVLNSLVEALTENKTNFVLPFKFYSVEKMRTSHYIIFVTKHPIACKIMKQIMYTNSAKDSDGVATFSFEDSRNFVQGLEQLSLFNKPLQDLKDSLVNSYMGKQAKVGELCSIADSDFTSHFVGSNVKEVLRQLESEGKITVVSGRKIMRTNGKLNMPDAAIIKFCEVI